MIEFCGQRVGMAIIPVSESDQIEIARIPARRVLTIGVSSPAPRKIERWYRAAVQMLVEATGRWPNREVAHREIMIKSGFFESFVISHAGDVRFTPASTQGWDIIAWREFIDRSLPVMIEFAGETKAQYRDRVDRFLGFKLKEALEG